MSEIGSDLVFPSNRNITNMFVNFIIYQHRGIKFKQIFCVVEGYKL